MRGWVGVDLDGTLATYETGMAPSIGEPIPAMVERVRAWLRAGYEVRIVTARASHPSYDRFQEDAIAQWCLIHIGAALKVQSCKDYQMIELWDDRAVQVETNTGRILSDPTKISRWREKP